jgi:mannose-6-phosphate isomerase-like protein (cupin superfamily)
MDTSTTARSPRNDRAGQTSYLLLAGGDFGSRNLAITLVHGEPGSEQPMHAHDAEQVYVIVEGRGLMRVDDEEQEVGPETLVFIPPGSRHAIRNVGGARLTYVSATSPSFASPPADSPFAYRRQQEVERG